MQVIVVVPDSTPVLPHTGAGVIAIPIGRSPTGMGVPGVLVARSIGVTALLSRLTT
ncbi:hypothetical protein MXD63_33005 [Frankia sp. Cpl3]|nr:hypothetical protein [Frankia sp. Cpl3]